MSGQNGDKPEGQPVAAPAPPALIVIRIWPGGWDANWAGCDVHQAMDVLEQALTKLREQHQREHEPVPHGDET